MWRKIILSIIIFLLGLGIYYYIKNHYHIDRNAITVALKPPVQNISQELPQGSDLNKPLTLPQEFKLAVFADLSGHGSPRVLKLDPNGVVFTSLTGAGKVVALPDKNNDGVVDEIVTIAKGLNKPHGLAFYQGKIYIAETDKVVRYDYDPASYRLTNKELLFSLPGGGRHFTRTINIYDNKLYTSVGSSCDVCKESDWKRASVLVSDLDGKNIKTFASGLRNTVFFVFDDSGRIWGNDMGRDYLGDNLPPDELNIIAEGGNYGWPWCFGEKVFDTKTGIGNQVNSTFCNSTQFPFFEYPAHIAALGLTLIKSSLFSSNDQGNLLVAFHGSWNSTYPVGYKIVMLNIKNGKVSGMKDFITGWLTSSGVIGRPVDLLFKNNGTLLISDDKANLIYILTKGN